MTMDDTLQCSHILSASVYRPCSHGIFVSVSISLQSVINCDALITLFINTTGKPLHTSLLSPTVGHLIGKLKVASVTSKDGLVKSRKAYN